MSHTDEFNILYSLLSNLSTKHKNAHALAPLKRGYRRKTPPSSDIIESIEPIELINDTHIIPIEPIEPINDTLLQNQCKSCTKPFLSEGALIVHYDRSPVCRKWAFLPDHLKEPVLPYSIHIVVDDYIRQATTGTQQFQCKFCLESFVNDETHRAHYHTSIACNRMAHLEFKKIVKGL